MSNPGKSESENGGGKGSLPFEEALQKLEQVVEAMESGDLPLEKLMQRFEEGTKLVRVCQSKLEEAEQKIEKLEKNLSGDLAVKPLKLSNDNTET